MQRIGTGIFEENGNLYTENPNEGVEVYGENLVERNSMQLREWVPKRSKAGAAVAKGISLGLEKDSTVLYLGAATGTTVSHFSDILTEGIIYAVEYSEVSARKLIELAEKRQNIAPIVGDARNPGVYSDMVGEVDVIFQDISQRDQAEIFLKNAEEFLKEGGKGLIAVKAHSISTSRDEEEVFAEVKSQLSDKFEFLEETRLEPYEKHHLFLKMEYRGAGE